MAMPCHATAIVHRPASRLADEGALAWPPRQSGVRGATSACCARLQGLKWEYMVVNSPMVNAMVLPGGKVIVFTGGGYSRIHAMASPC